MHNPTVGEILKFEFMVPLNLTTFDLAKSMNIQYNRISNILANRSKITPFLDNRLSKRFGTSIGYWLKLQEEYDKFEKRKK